MIKRILTKVIHHIYDYTRDSNADLKCRSEVNELLNEQGEDSISDFVLQFIQYSFISASVNAGFWGFILGLLSYYFTSRIFK